MDTLPSVQTSESSVLSILMNKPEAFDDCTELQPEHFPTDWLRTLFVETETETETEHCYFCAGLVLIPCY